MAIQRDFTEQEFKTIQAESHQAHINYGEIMADFEEKENKLNEQFLGLFTTFLTSVGVIAGFGFTSLGNVVNRILFFAGELLLLSLIVFGLFILFFYNKAREKTIKEGGEKYHTLLSPRLSLYKGFLTLAITKKELYEKLSKDDEKQLNFKFESNLKILDLNKFLYGALIMLIIGIILLFTSFINLNFSNKYSNWPSTYYLRLCNCIPQFHNRY